MDQRARPDRLPERAAHRERPGRRGAGAARRRGRTAVGTLTSGGTESCLLAVLAARETWRARGGVGRARLVLPVTAHAAFRKAAHLFDLEVADVPVDPVTCRADAAAVAGAPRRADGAGRGQRAVVPARRARPGRRGGRRGRRGAACRCHVDACIGGWVLPFLRRRPGARSTCRVARRHQPVGRPAQVRLRAQGRLGAAAPPRPSCARRTGSPPPAGPATRWSTRRSPAPGRPVPMAAAWAVHRLLGTDGYRELARRRRTRRRWRWCAGVADIPGIRVVGRPVVDPGRGGDDGGADGRGRAEPGRRDDRPRLAAAAPAAVRAARRRPARHAAPDRDRGDRGPGPRTAGRPRRCRPRPRPRSPGRSPTPTWWRPRPRSTRPR